ncbi:MAG: efflux RND transporter permease subunit [Rikenellaceae bacterium]
MKFLINRKITISMMFIALIFLGLISYDRLLIELLPTTELPTMTVSVSSSSTSDPTYLESDIVIPLESVIGKTSGVEQITSNINTRGATIVVEFKASTDLETTSISFSKDINEAALDFPDGFNVSVTQANTESMSSSQFMTLNVKGDGDVDQILAVTEEDLQTKLENIDGIVGVNIYGGRQQSVEIKLNEYLAEAMNITTSTITSSLSNAGNQRNFVGYTNSNNNENLGVFIEGGYDHISQISEIVVNSDGPIYLRDIADISYELQEPTSISRINGQRSISVGLNSESGANIIELTERVEQEIEALNEMFVDHGITIAVASSNAEEIVANIEQIKMSGLVGGALSVLILWFFLQNIGLALSVSLAIPISVFAAFNLFYAFDITINALTLLGIALAIGMLLDNSIVVLENIYRLFGEGKSPEDAVIEGTRQVWRSIIASTLTTVTVFLPFVFTDNIIIALLGKNLGISIISTLCFSLLVSLLLIPMITYLIIRGKKRSDSVFSEKVSIQDRMVQVYIIILKSFIRQPAIVITTTMLLLLITFTWASNQTETSTTSVGSDIIKVYAEMDDDITISESDEITTEIESRLDSLPERYEVTSMVRESSANISIQLKEDFNKNGGRQIGEIIDDVYNRLNKTEGVNTLTVSSGVSSSGSSTTMDVLDRMLSSMGIGETQNELVVTGSDYEEMMQVAEDLQEQISELDFISNTSVSVQRGSSVVDITVDPILSTSLEIGSQQISNALSDLSSQVSSGTQIQIDDDLIDIVISIASEEDDSVETVYSETKTYQDLKDLKVSSGSGALYKLDDIADIKKDVGKSSIQRVNKVRELKITYRFSQSDLTDEITSGYKSEIDDLIAEYPMSAGIAVEHAEADTETDDFDFLIAASILLIYMIIAIVFESTTLPIILMFAIPLAAIGSFVALIFSGNSVGNINVLTGFLILIGIVVNGGIILLDYTTLLRKRGYSRNRALLTSGASRLKPILITTITTIVALLPLALGGDDYAGAIGAPFAITVIGGLAFSSALTLILLPTLYVSMEGIIKWYRELPVWIYIIHGLIFAVVLLYVFLTLSGIYERAVYIIFALALIPGMTYIIRTSVRIANSKVIGDDEPITIVVRNLVKIYDRPGRFAREWKGAKELRRRLGLDSECRKLSDLNDLVWKSLIVVVLYIGAVNYFENVLWITLMLLISVLLTASMWVKLHKYLLNRSNGVEGKLLSLVNVSFNFVLVFIALSSSFVTIENKSITAIYLFLILLGYLMYRLARRAERLNINIERINGRFAAIRRAAYNISQSMPIIGKRKTPFMALKGVSFTITNGMFGLLGSNGAGKSTFMRIITGIYEQSYGTIWINGKDTREYREELQSLIGFLPQEFGTYEQMSAWDFLNYQAILKGIDNKEVRTARLEYVLTAVHMLDRKDAKISSFSGGMKQRIGIALILLNLPRILVVDEPTAGLDPRERIRFRNLLVELSRERIVIFSTHIIEDIASSCNQVVVINRGDLCYFGEPNDMLKFAEDKVWSFSCSEEEFLTIDHTRVANHMRHSTGDIKVRYVSKEKPFENAVREEESLEDAYLCLLKNL